MVSGQPEVKVIEGLTNLHADAVIIGTHDRSSISRCGLYFLPDFEIQIAYVHDGW